MQNQIIDILQWILIKLTGLYPVHWVSVEDIQQATGQPRIKYTHEDMQNLVIRLQQDTYNGDDWCTVINQFNNDLQ